MVSHEEFNVHAIANLARHLSAASRLRSKTKEILSATQEALARSRALVAEADARLTMKIMQPGGLWPAY
jgi:hypothetical protein